MSYFKKEDEGIVGKRIEIIRPIGCLNRGAIGFVVRLEPIAKGGLGHYALIRCINPSGNVYEYSCMKKEYQSSVREF